MNRVCYGQLNMLYYVVANWQSNYQSARHHESQLYVYICRKTLQWLKIYGILVPGIEKSSNSKIFHLFA